MPGTPCTFANTVRPKSSILADSARIITSYGPVTPSAMVHSIFLLLIVVFLAPIFSRIPSAAIAGVLIGTSFRIFNKASMLEIFRSSKRNIFIYIITALVTVSIDLIWGIAVGIALYLIINQFKRAITTKIFRK